MKAGTWTQVPKSWTTICRECGPSAAALWHFYLDHCRPGNLTCWPSVRRAADELGLSRTTIRTLKKRLADAGFIDVQRRRDQSGAERAPLITVVIPGNPVPPPQKLTRGGQDLTRPPPTFEPWGDADSAPEEDLEEQDKEKKRTSPVSLTRGPRTDPATESMNGFLQQVNS